MAHTSKGVRFEVSLTDKRTMKSETKPDLRKMQIHHFSLTDGDSTFALDIAGVHDALRHLLIRAEYAALL